MVNFSVASTTAVWPLLSITVLTAGRMGPQSPPNAWLLVSNVMFVLAGTATSPGGGLSVSGLKFDGGPKNGTFSLVASQPPSAPHMKPASPHSVPTDTGYWQVRCGVQDDV